MRFHSHEVIQKYDFWQVKFKSLQPFEAAGLLHNIFHCNIPTLIIWIHMYAQTFQLKEF